MDLVVLPFSCFSAFWMLPVTLVYQVVVTVCLGPKPVSTVHLALLILNQLSLVEILVAMFGLQHYQLLLVLWLPDGLPLIDWVDVVP